MILNLMFRSFYFNYLKVIIRYFYAIRLGINTQFASLDLETKGLFLFLLKLRWRITRTVFLFLKSHLRYTFL